MMQEDGGKGTLRSAWQEQDHTTTVVKTRQLPEKAGYQERSVTPRRKVTTEKNPGRIIFRWCT